MMETVRKLFETPFDIGGGGGSEMFDDTWLIKSRLIGFGGTWDMQCVFC